MLRRCLLRSHESGIRASRATTRQYATSKPPPRPSNDKPPARKTIQSLILGSVTPKSRSVPITKISDTPTSSSQPQSPGPPSHFPYTRLLTYTLTTFLTYHIFTSYFYNLLPAYGISMLPTINSYGDSLLVSRWYRRGRGIEVGDLVSFKHPVKEGEEGVKRVVGWEGDWVCLSSGAGRGGGHAREGEEAGSDVGRVIQVPQGHCWVVGDNLLHSRDSRLFGPLPLALIRGKVVARYWLWWNWEWIENGLKDAEMVEDGID